MRKKGMSFKRLPKTPNPGFLHRLPALWELCKYELVKTKLLHWLKKHCAVRLKFFAILCPNFKTPNEEALPLVLVLGDISAYIYVLQVGGWAWGNHRLCTRFEPNSWLLLMKASSRWSGVTWGDANYWCLCPSGKEKRTNWSEMQFSVTFWCTITFL